MYPALIQGIQGAKLRRQLTLAMWWTLLISTQGRSTFQTVWRLKSIFGSHQIPNDTNIYKLDGVYTIRHVVYTISLRTLRTLGHTTYPTYTNISNLKVCPDVLNDPTTDLNWSILVGFCSLISRGQAQ